MSQLRTALRTRGQSLTVPTMVSLVLHVGAVVTAVVLRGLGALLVMMFPWCASESTPLLQPDIEVAVVSLPKSQTKMPDRAARAKRPKPVKQPTPAPKPPPVKESDLVVRTKKPPPEPGVRDDSDVARADALSEILRQDALDELLDDAPEGPRDRLPTSPDGEGEEVIGSAVGAMGDPELARWYAKVRGLYQQNFNPITTGRDLRARGKVVFDPSNGQVLSAELIEPSGVIVFDEAARRALARIQSLPLPPGDRKGNFITIEFEPKS